MVLLLVIINLLFSLPFAVSLYSSLQDSMGLSEASEKMAKGFDYLWWEEYKDQSEGIEKTFSPSIIGPGAILNNLQALAEMRLTAVPPILLAWGVLYLILRSFLAGGILSIYNQERPKFDLKRFAQGAASFFSRFFTLMLISWAFFLAVATVLNYGFRPLLENISEKANSEVEPFLFGLLFSLTILVLLLFIQMVFDYARIKIVVENHRNVLKASFKAFGFVFKHIFSTLSLYYLIVFMQVATAIIYIYLKSLIPQINSPFVLGAFVLQQLFIFALLWLRCLLYSSQMELYRYL